jgi:AcrR family transcriptional regulator
MPTADPLLPRKPPRQARSAAMVELILQAAARVLATESLGGFTTNRVAEVAGVSVGSLYQYFPNKSALVAALIEREQNALAEAVESAVARLGGVALPQGVAALAALAVQHQFGRPLYAAALDHEERRLPVQATLLAAQQRIVVAVAAWLSHHHPQWGAAALRVAAADCLTIAKALVEAEPAGTKPALGALRQRVQRAVLGYLEGGDKALAPTSSRASSAGIASARKS